MTEPTKSEPVEPVERVGLAVEPVEPEPEPEPVDEADEPELGPRGSETP